MSSVLSSSSSFLTRLSLQRMALDNPRASAVDEDMFSTIWCLNFLRIRSRVLPCFGSACSLLYLIVTSFWKRVEIVKLFQVYYSRNVNWLKNPQGGRRNLKHLGSKNIRRLISRKYGCQ